MNDIIRIENITGLIFLIRGQRVMLDRDLAGLYGVETRVLNQSVNSIVNHIKDRIPVMRSSCFP
jgi:hypothetical protein